MEPESSLPQLKVPAGPRLTLWMFRNMILFYGELLAPRPTPKLKDHPCRLSVTAYAIYSQLPSILQAASSSATTRFNIQKLCMVITLRLCVLYGSRNKQ
jgi:hypothetical protein